MNNIRFSTTMVSVLLKRSLAVTGLSLAAAIPAWAACSYTVTNNWGAGFTAEIKVTNNTSQTVNNWSVSWQESAATLSNAWNANVTGSNPYTAASVGWNGTLAPGASASFGAPCDYWVKFDYNISTGDATYQKTVDNCENREKKVIQSQKLNKKIAPLKMDAVIPGDSTFKFPNVKNEIYY